MISATRIRPYKYLAEFYDQLFGHFDYARDAERQAAIGSILPLLHSACDLACGSGTTAVKLAKRGIRTIAVDLSPSMCRLVRQKARREGVATWVLRADMRKFRLPEPVDLITCEGDALNHVERKSDLVAVARSASRALNPGGWFYFEVNNRVGFKRYWKNTFWQEKPGVVMVMRSGNDASHDRAWTDVEWFIRGARGSWQRRHERIQEVCWSSGEVRTTLRKAGFGQVRTLDAAPYWKGNLITPGCRSLCLARRAS